MEKAQQLKTILELVETKLGLDVQLPEDLEEPFMHLEA